MGRRLWRLNVRGFGLQRQEGQEGIFATEYSEAIAAREKFFRPSGGTGYEVVKARWD